MHTPAVTPPALRGPGPVTDLGRMLVGFVVLATGVLFLLDAANVLDAGRAVSRWWPAVIVAAGVLTLAERPPAVVRGTILTAVGVVGLLFTTGVLGEGGWDYVWPVAVVLAGLAVLANWRGRAIPGGAHPEDVIRTTAVLGGSEVASADPAFRGAWLTAILGGVVLDLREATPAPEGASVNATAAFGGVDLIVPRGWRLVIRSVPVFGGVEDKTDHTAPPAAGAPVLHVDAVSIFGGVSIKHEKD